MSETLHPVGYGRSMVTLSELADRHSTYMLPEYERRLFAWLATKPGIGIGGGHRVNQPVRPGFAPPGRSFHQTQHFADGQQGYCAVDLVVARAGHVHRAPTWSEVPVQGSAEAKRWGLHANVGQPGQAGSEPWHLQPIEIDGYGTWLAQGRPAPLPDYPLPSDPPATVPPMQGITLHPTLGVMWRHHHHAELFWLCNGSVVHIDATMMRALEAQGVDRIESDNLDVFHSYALHASSKPEGSPLT